MSRGERTMNDCAVLRVVAQFPTVAASPAARKLRTICWKRAAFCALVLPQCFHRARKVIVAVAAPSGLGQRPEAELPGRVGSSAGPDRRRASRTRRGPRGSGRGRRRCPDVQRSIAVALRPRLGQREVDHRPQRQRGGQRVAVRQGLGGRREKLIVIAVNLAVAVDQQPSGTFRRRPVDEEAQGTERAGCAAA